MKSPSIKFSRIPLLGTDCYTDLRWILLLFPVWWVLGFEQFIWPVLLLWVVVKLLIRKQFKLRIPPLAGAFALFLISQLFSAIFISASFRYISFIRTFSTFFSVLLLTLIFENADFSDQENGNLIDTVLISISMAGLLGLMAELGLWRPKVNSLISYLLPAAVKNTSYGSVIAYRSLGNPSWFSGLGSYFRLSSLFLYPTLYGSALAFVLPIGFYRFAYPSKVWTKPRSFLLIAVMLYNLIYTTGRTAILSFLLAGLLFLWFFSKQKTQYRLLLILLASLILISFILVSFLDLAVFDQIVELLSSFLYARGEGTVVSRLSIYGNTLEDFLRRPLWGWGTERDIEGIKIPLGSHSFYLALLYRFGLAGFSIYCFILLKIWVSLVGIRKPIEGADADGFLRYVKWVVLAGFLDGLFTVPLLDINTLMFFWIPVILGLNWVMTGKNRSSIPED